MTNRRIAFGELWRRPDDTFKVEFEATVLRDALKRAAFNGFERVFIDVKPHMYTLANGRIVYDPIRGEATVDGKPYNPSLPRSTQLLGLLSMQPDTIVRRDYLAEILKIPKTKDPNAVIDTALYGVRRALPTDLARPKMGVIRTVTGQGFIGLSKIET